ncbi:MAG: 30S ribosomal protein S6e [DPANN group archaeon]|nr:30S ribosomal protein S6e [DPANN group archaeon]
MVFKFVINNPKTGKSYQKEIEDKVVFKPFIGKKIDDTIDGALLGLIGYTLVIRGGSDNAGTPMRKDVMGSVRKRIYLAGGLGYKPIGKGVKRRKMIRGNTISEDVAQVNVSISKAGTKSLEELLGIAPEETKDESADSKSEAKE